MSELYWYGTYGYYPANPDGVYDEAYFEKYQHYSETDLGVQLTQARNDLVTKHVGDAPVLDFGIGSGQFCDARPGTVGFDVNPTAIEWLQGSERWVDLWDGAWEGPVTFWDSLEHVQNLEGLLRRCQSWIFVSLPIFTSEGHVLRSRHFRPDEHFWYFTHEGFIEFLHEDGFEFIEHNTMETELGREDIGTYVFKRY